MKRDYPTFLFCNPANTVSKGPFLIHSSEPRFIARIAKLPVTNTENGVHDDKHILFILDQVEDQIELKHITNAALKWLKVQVNAGFIKF